MPRDDYRKCKHCGRSASEVGPLSHTRLCGECGVVLAELAALSLAAHHGTHFNRWRRGMAASVGAVLLDERQASA